MSGPNGLSNMPWTNPPVPTPGGEGTQGIGGGLESDAGPNGIQNSPWTSPPMGTNPSLSPTGGDGDLPQAPTFSSLTDNIAPGTSFDPGQDGMKGQNTIDKR